MRVRKGYDKNAGRAMVRTEEVVKAGWKIEERKNRTKKVNGKKVGGIEKVVRDKGKNKKWNRKKAVRHWRWNE